MIMIAPLLKTINARALEHESSMLDAYTEMETDSVKSKLQTVLTAYYQGIKGVPGGSGGHKPRVIKLRFHDKWTPYQGQTTTPASSRRTVPSRAQPRQQPRKRLLPTGRSLQLLLRLRLRLRQPPAHQQRRREVARSLKALADAN